MPSTAKPYDFQALPKLTRRYLAITESLFAQFPQLESNQNLAQNLTRIFSEELGIPTEVQWVGFEEVRYADFLESLPSPCIAVQLLAEPMQMRLVAVLDPTLAKRWVQHLLSGDAATALELKALSPLEEGLLEFVIAKALQSFQDAPGMLGNVGVRISKIASEAKLLNLNSQAESEGCLFKFYLSHPGYGGYVKIYCPYPFLEGTLLREDAVAGLLAPGSEDTAPMSRVGHVKISLWLELGKIRLAASEQQSLEKGDVILFDETRAAMGPHGLSGKAILRVGEGGQNGLLSEIIDVQHGLELKVLDFYGGD